MKLLVVLFTFPLLFSVVGCSSTSSKNAQEIIDYDANTDYREVEDQLSETLDMPPNLFLMDRQKNDFDRAMNQKISADPEAGYKFIPTYRADMVSINHNLSERWLEVSGLTSEQVWEGVQAFMVSMGFEIKEARKDIGFIRTKFLPRKELVPLDAQGPLTRVLNSWRPELAEGVYDRLIARVTYDENIEATRVYFFHYMISDETQDLDDGFFGSSSSDSWKIRPFNPMIEAEALYQAMIFFGASQQSSLQQIEATESLIELSEGETEFNGLKLHANKDESWNYLVAMIYRANWAIEDMNRSHFVATVRLPDSGKETGGIMSSLVFWKDKEEAVPQIVQFKLTTKGSVNQSYSLLTVHSMDNNQPLSSSEQKHIFKSLGLLGK